MHRFSTASRFATLLLIAGTLTCGGDGQGPSTGPSKLAMATQPSATAQPAVAFEQQPVVQVQDADGQSTPASGATVAVEVVESGVVLNGTMSRDVDAQGRATFTDLSLSGPAGTYTLRFTASGLTAATSAGIVLAGAPATMTVVTQPPATALTGEVFDPASQPAVTLTDAGGNPMAGVTVTASKASGSGTLEGGLTATTDAAGVAKFQDLGISGTGAHTLAFTSATLNATSSAVALSPLPAEAATGKWGAPVPWGIVPLHIHLLPTGKILAWGKFENSTMVMSDPRLWDPAAGTPQATARTVAADTMLFCSGHAFMPDGKLMVSGGHKLDDRGLDVTNVFDPIAETWEAKAKMARGRWYPSVTELPDGRMVTVAGKDTNQTTVLLPEVWENNATWRQLTGASLVLPYYPRDFVAPDGRVFMAGERTTSRWLDVNAGGGAGSWTSGPAHIWPFNRDYGSAVMYDAGKILYVGGGGDLTWDTPDPKNAAPTATAEKIDLDQLPTPAWQSAGSLPKPRRHLNATVLPDGEVLVTGGLSGGTFNNLATGERAAEIWNPATNNWTELAMSSVVRGYHSVSILLPDATVLHGGSGNANIPGTSTPYPDEESHEIFQPPYLFKGARPAISSAPATVGYTSSFQVNTPNVGQVATVRIIRLGSVTHAFDMNGRVLTLPFASSVGGISVTAPASTNLAPPGDYMLFILNRNGVPSAGRMIRIQ